MTPTTLIFLTRHSGSGRGGGSAPHTPGLDSGTRREGGSGGRVSSRPLDAEGNHPGPGAGKGASRPYGQTLARTRTGAVGRCPPRRRDETPNTVPGTAWKRPNRQLSVRADTSGRVYRGRMPAASSASSDPAGIPAGGWNLGGAGADLGELSPKAIRAGLLPEEAATFHAQFRSAMTEASESLDLTGVLEFLRHWRLIATASTADPHAHRQIMATAARLAAGQDVPTEAWPATKARLGL